MELWARIFRPRTRREEKRVSIARHPSGREDHLRVDTVCMMSGLWEARKQVYLIGTNQATKSNAQAKCDYDKWDWTQQR